MSDGVAGSSIQQLRAAFSTVWSLSRCTEWALWHWVVCLAAAAPSRFQLTTMSETINLSHIHTVSDSQQHLQRARHPHPHPHRSFSCTSELPTALRFICYCWGLSKGEISLTKYPFHLPHFYTRLMLNWGWELPFPPTASLHILPRMQQLEATVVTCASM